MLLLAQPCSRPQMANKKKVNDEYCQKLLPMNDFMAMMKKMPTKMAAM
jgi:hypothetical protein